MTRWLFLFLLLAAVLPAQAQPAAERTTEARLSEARLYVLADSAAIGERFQIALTARHEAGTQALFPDADPDGAQTLGQAAILSKRRLPPRPTFGGARVDSVVYEAAVFERLTASVGPARVRLVTGGDTVEVLSDQAVLRIAQTVPANAQSLQPNAPLLDFPPTLAERLASIALIALGLVALALLGVLGWWLWTQRRRRSLAPDQQALARLRALVVPTTPQAVEPFYEELSDALRAYLTYAFGLSTYKQTTNDLARRLAADPQFSDETSADLVSTLRQADLVKFAKRTPPEAEHAETLAQARRATDALERQRAEEAEARKRGKEPA